MHGEKQPHQTEVMVAVKMGNEDVVYAVQVCLETHQLHLRPFSTVDEKESILDLNQLRGWKSAISRQCAAGAKYGDVETQIQLTIGQ